MIEVTDQLIDQMARSMWQVDTDAHGYDDMFALRSWERVKPLYRRRAEAAAAVVEGALAAASQQDASA